MSEDVSKAERRNSAWQGRVKSLTAQGWGSEDIANRLGCDLQDVRREIQILRESGELKKMFGGKK